MKRTIAVVTTSRADYAHLRWLLYELAKRPAIQPKVIALGPHLSPEFGHTGKEVNQDGFGDITTLECLLSSDTDIGMAKTIGVATLGLADALGKMRPDLLLLIADRYEMLAPASVALALRIPIVHIEGGEITAGAIDDAVRNAITKMAHIHFACTRAAARRIVAMGEERKRVHWSGSLSLDELRRTKLLSKVAVERNLGIRLDRPTVVCVYHPVTLKQDTTEEAAELFAALDESSEQVLFVYPNADTGSRRLIARMEQFVTRRGGKLFVNLEHGLYLSLLAHSDLLIGNSSSGIIESTSLALPAINVGDRQHGREHARNVLDVPADRKDISKAIRHALSREFRLSVQHLDNPYGDGHAAERVTKILATVRLGPQLLLKAGI